MPPAALSRLTATAGTLLPGPFEAYALSGTRQDKGASLCDGLDQAALPQLADCLTNRAAGDIEFLFQVLLARDGAARLNLSAPDALGEDVSELPVDRDRSLSIEHVKTVIDQGRLPTFVYVHGRPCTTEATLLPAKGPRRRGEIRMHLPHRPSWNCRACGQPWPCEQYRQACLAEPTDSIGLATRMEGHRRQAAADLHEDGEGALRMRFLGWIKERS